MSPTRQLAYGDRLPRGLTIAWGLRDAVLLLPA